MPANLLLLSTADTDLLAASQADAGWRVANPSRVELDSLPNLLDDVEVVVVRLLGGRRAWEAGLDAVISSGIPTVVLSGEAAPDAELMSLSTVAAGAVTEALAYLREGGSTNLANLAGFLRDTLLLTGDAFDPPQALPAYGVRAGRSLTPDGRPVVGIVYYRAHEISGNTAFVDALADAVETAGAQALPIYCGTLRGLDPSSDDNAELFAILRRCDVLVTTLLAAGGTVAADASAGGADDAWDAGALASLDIPLIQGLALTSTREQWLESDAAISPLDAATQVAIPEFDGRLITIPFSFKAYDAEGIASYAPDGERCARLAGIAVAQAKLRHVEPKDKKLALVLSSYPTKHARIGNAVGLDTPASAVVLLGHLKDAGYD
ncbi:MAG: cobaltochelatase subunit CobN, partial [Nocardioidaceae bacterium]